MTFSLLLLLASGGNGGQTGGGNGSSSGSEVTALRSQISDKDRLIETMEQASYFLNKKIKINIWHERNYKNINDLSSVFVSLKLIFFKKI